MDNDLKTSHDAAVSKCRGAYPIQGAHFAAPLIVYLNTPPSERRVFEWLIPCVGDVLDHLGVNALELREALELAERSLVESDHSEAIEATAWELWNQRVPGDARTAVAQLLFALRGYRMQRENIPISCAAPLSILDRMASKDGEILERVVSNFTKYAGR